MEGIKRLNKEYSNKPGVQRESGSVDTMLADTEKTEKKKQLALILEKQIQSVCNISLNEIDVDEVEKTVKELEDYCL
jgi:hypothetical protein